MLQNNLLRLQNRMHQTMEANMEKQETEKYAPEVVTQEDLENAVKCQCCKEWQVSDYMKRAPEGWYCESCFDDIYG